MNNTNVSWKSFKRLFPNIISVVKILCVIIVTDMVISISLSYVISDTFYFKRYMKGANYEQMIAKYYNKTLSVQPHPEAGWGKNPNFKNGDEGWRTRNSLSSRISPIQDNEDVKSQKINNDNLVILLGSSAISGYILPFEQSPAGQLINKGYQALDSGIVMYTIDQSYELYKYELSKYKPKVLVVGIHNEAEYISSMFSPFRDEVGIDTPFLKPSYHLAKNAIVKNQPPIDSQRLNDIPKMLSTLEKYDGYFYKFQLFKRLSLLPFSDYIRKLILKYDNNFYNDADFTKAVNLQLEFMKQLNDLAKKNGTTVIFVKFERSYEVSIPASKKILTLFFKDKNQRHNQLLREKSLNILYISDIFKKTGRPLSELYFENDTVHLSADACLLLADQIDQEIKSVMLPIGNSE